MHTVGAPHESEACTHTVRDLSFYERPFNPIAAWEQRGESSHCIPSRITRLDTEHKLRRPSVSDKATKWWISSVGTVLLGNLYHVLCTVSRLYKLWVARSPEASPSTNHLLSCDYLLYMIASNHKVFCPSGGRSEVDICAGWLERTKFFIHQKSCVFTYLYLT